MNKALSLTFSLPLSIFKEDGVFVAHTPALDISTCGDSVEEAKKSFEELVVLFIQELERKGTTDEVLTSMGWVKANKVWAPPVEVHHEMQTFSVPVPA
ncbi:MAG: hypothetical protein WCO52_04795 [bacterium]